MGFMDKLVGKTMRQPQGAAHQPPVMPVPVAPAVGGPPFNASAFKQKLKIGKTRATVQQGKAKNAAFKTRQAVIVELRANKNPTACLKMEQYLRDMSSTEAHDVLEAYIELLIARVHLIESTPVFDDLPSDCKEAVASVVFASARLGNAELRDASNQLKALYTAAVVDPLTRASGPNAHCINSLLARKLEGTAPDDFEILEGLKAVAAEEGIPWHAPAEPDELRKPAGSGVSSAVDYPNFMAANVPGPSAPTAGAGAYGGGAYGGGDAGGGFPGGPPPPQPPAPHGFDGAPDFGGGGGLGGAPGFDDGASGFGGAYPPPPPPGGQAPP